MTHPGGRATVRAQAFWLAAALAFVALWMGRSLAPSLDRAVVQDDARQHVFWMQRLVDPSLLRDDLFAAYFEGQAPIGYVALFRPLLTVTDPLTASKLLPPILGLVAAVCTFRLVLRLYPSPVAAFLVTVLGSWYVWQYDDLPTGSPRAFLLPLVAALLWALAADRHWTAIGLVTLAATLYPSAAVLGVALVGMRMLRLDRWPPRLDLRRSAWRRFGLALLLALALLLPSIVAGSPFGPAVDGATARAMPEFGPAGRNAFFTPDPYAFWLASYRAGFDLRVTDALFPSVPIFFELAALALLLPVAVVVWRSRRTATGVCAEPSPAHVVETIVQVLAASLVLFALAHAVLFRLYLPARFVAWTVPLALALAAGVGLAMLLARLARRLAPGRADLVAGGLALLLALGLAAYPARFDGNFVRDRLPAVSAYLREQAPDVLVAGVPMDADSVPAFAGRRVLTNREYALAYHLGFYAEVERRTRDLIDAYYSDSPERVSELATRYGIDYLLVNQAAFEPATVVDAWAGSFEPYTGLVRDRADRRRRYALLDLARRCGVLTEQDVTVVPTPCFVQR